MSEYWGRGEMAALAKAADMQPSLLSAILHRQKGVSKDRACKLEVLTRQIFEGKKEIHYEDWRGNLTTLHPAFFGKPGKPSFL